MSQDGQPDTAEAKGNAPRRSRAARWQRAALLTLLLVTTSFGLVQTRQAKDWAASFLSERLSAGPGRQVVVGTIRGFLPFRIELDSLSLADAEGRWLALDEVSVRWHPWALLHRRVDITELRARAISLDRRPRRAAGPPQKRSPTSILQRVAQLPSIRVASLAVDRLALGESLAGRAAAFRVRGDVAGESTRIASFLMERTDGPKTSLTARVELDRRNTPVLSVNAQCQEEPDGYLAALLRVPERNRRLDVALAGEGPTSAWQGRLTGAAWDMGTVDLAVSLAENVDYSLGLDGIVRVAQASVPEKVGALVAGDTRIAMAARYERAGIVTVDRLAVEGELGRLGFTGRMDRSGDGLDGTFSWNLDALSRLDALAGVPLGGAAAVTGTFTGTLGRPEAVLTAAVTGLRVDTLHATRAGGTIRLESLTDLKEGYGGVRVGGNGTVADLSVDDGPDMPEPNVAWDVAFDAPKEAPVALASLTLDGKDTRVTLSGEVRTEGPSGSLDAAVEMRALRTFAGLLGVDVDGAATLRAHVEGDLGTRSLDADVDATVNGLTGLPEAAQVALGDSVGVTGKVAVAEGQRVSVGDLVVRGVAVLQGRGAVDLEEKTLGSEWEVALADASVYRGLLDRPVSGALHAHGTTAGTFEQFETTADVEGTDLTLDQARVTRATVHVDAQGLPRQPAGRLSLEALCAEERLNATAAFALADKTLRLPDVAVQAPGAEVTAALNVVLDGALVDGSLRGRSDDVGKLVAAMDTLLGRAGVTHEMAGTVTVDVALASADRRQNATVSAAVTDLAGTFGQVRNGQAEGDFKDLRGTLSGRLSAALDDYVVTGEAAFERIDVSASGDLDKIVFEGQAKGLPYTPFDVAAAGSVGFSEDAQQLDLTRFDGEYRDVTFGLAQPSMFKRSGSEYTIEGLAATLGSGRLDVSGRYAANDLSATCTWRDLPLDAARLVGVDGLAGKVAGSLRVSGTPAAPQAQASLNVTEITQTGESAESGQPMTLAGEGTYSAGRCRATLDLTGLVDKPIHAMAAVPVDVSFAPFSMALVEDGPLEARLEAEAALERIGDLLLLDEHHVTGALTVSFDLQGTLKAPELAGRAVIENGTYEYEPTGTVLRDVAIELQAKGPRIELVRASAGDGGSGSLTAQGRVELDRKASFPLALGVQFNDARLLRRDDLTAVVGGKLDLAGTSEAARLTGALTVPSADIRIAERPAAASPAMDVIEINVPGGEAEPPPEVAAASEHSLAKRVALDVGVDLPGRVFVQAPNFNSEWRGSFKVGGQASAPSIAGTLSAVRGRLMFLNRRFTMASSSVTLDGQYPPAPGIDVALETQASDLTARLRVAGAASAPEVTLTSVPTLPQDEILARLLFGKDMKAISPMRAYQLAQAAQVLSGTGGAFGFLRRTRRTFGFDELQLTQSDQEGKGAALSAGKYLGDKIYVEMEKDIRDTGGRVSVDAEITPSIKVQSEVGSDAKGGLWLQWERDY